MNDIESHVTRPNLPQNRVEVRPIVVEQTTRVMDGLCNLENILLEIPSVFGLVIIRPAVLGPATLRRASRSTVPSLFDGTTTTLNPAIAALAGFVPWAESGIIISRLLSNSPFDS